MGRVATAVALRLRSLSRPGVVLPMEENLPDGAIFFTAFLEALSLTVAGIIVLTHVCRASRIKPLPKDSKIILACPATLRGMVNFPKKSRSSHP